MIDRISLTEELLKSIDGGLYPEQIQQILDDQEKAEKYDACKNLITQVNGLLNENKQLKIDNDVMRKYNKTMTEGLQEEISKNGNLKQKLDKIYEFVKSQIDVSFACREVLKVEQM